MEIPSLHIWKALDENIAIIICRYPHDNYQMVRWSWIENEKHINDTFEKGQWLVNRKKIKFNRCALSPDGSYFSFFMFDFSNSYNTYTIISKPPYFTAMYIQEEEGTWTGGAHFQDTTNIIMKPYILMFNKLPPNMKIIDPSPKSKIGGGGREERFMMPKKLEANIKGRKINIREGKIFADDEMIADFCGDTFRQSKAPY